MDKIQLGPKTLIYPMPVLVVGSNVNGKANFMVAAWGGIANGNPPMISVAIRAQRHTLIGINQNMAFSINFQYYTPRGILSLYSSVDNNYYTG